MKISHLRKFCYLGLSENPLDKLKKFEKKIVINSLEMSRWVK